MKTECFTEDEPNVHMEHMRSAKIGLLHSDWESSTNEETGLCPDHFRRKSSLNLMMKTHHQKSHQIQSPQEVLSLQTF